MNIFILDRDPAIAARMQCDKHVVKMPLECAQMLSTAHRELDTFPSSIAHDSSIYRSTHKHHPCNRWLRQSAANYHWLYDHFEPCAQSIRIAITNFTCLGSNYRLRSSRRHLVYLTVR